MRRYVSFEFDAPFRTNPDLWFGCLKCGGVVRSAPKGAWHCECGNISIDASACAFDVGERAKVRAFYREDDAV